MISTEAIERFWALVDKKADTAVCWPWNGARIYAGYGRWRPSRDEPELYTHRVAYAATHGIIESQFVVMHICHNRICCNPAHLRAGTETENRLHESVSSNKQRRDNSSGVKGVAWMAARKAWRARGTADKKEISLYWGPSFDEAVQARRAWEAKISERLSSTLNI